MEFKFVIPVSKTHRGAVQMAWVPNGSIPTGDITNVAWNVIYDVTTGNIHNLTVGYAREDPFLQNRLFTMDMPIKPYFACNGQLIIRVVNPLLAQATGADTKIFVYARALPNMEFAVPRDEIGYMNEGEDPVSFPIQSTVRLEGGALGDSDSPIGETTGVLVSPSNPIPSHALYFGEQVSSVRALLQKPSKLNVIEMLGTVIVPQFLWAPGVVVSPPLDTETVWTYVGYYKNLFVGLAASERFKAFPARGAWIGACRFARQPTSDPSLFTPTMCPMTYAGPGLGAEFVIPYYYPRKYVVCRATQDSDPSATNWTSLVAYPANGEEGVKVIWYHSLGPDIRATCFRQVPHVRFKAPDGPFTPWW